jgi:hypothetical protein
LIGAVLALTACRVPPLTVEGVVKAKPHPGVETVGAEYRDGRGPELFDYGSLTGIVVFVEGAGEGARTKATTTLRAAGFDPPVVALARGGTLEVTNGTGAEVTLFAEGIVLPTAVAAGGTARLAMTRLGPATLLVWELEKALLRAFVAPNEHVGVWASGKAFAFKLPRPGEYVLRAWHWRLPPAEKSFRVDAERGAEVELVLGVGR